MKVLNKKSIMGNLSGAAQGLLVLGIVVVVGMVILNKILNTTSVVTANDYGYNATKTTLEAMQTIPDFLPIVVIGIIGFLLIGLVAFRRFRG